MERFHSRNFYTEQQLQQSWASLPPAAVARRDQLELTEKVHSEDLAAMVLVVVFPPVVLVRHSTCLQARGQEDD